MRPVCTGAVAEARRGGGALAGGGSDFEPGDVRVDPCGAARALGVVTPRRRAARWIGRLRAPTPAPFSSLSPLAPSAKRRPRVLTRAGRALFVLI